MSEKRIGQKMQEVIEYVENNPGCTKIGPARHVGPYGSLKYGYQTVNRVISRGLIKAERQKNGVYTLNLN